MRLKLGNRFNGFPISSEHTIRADFGKPLKRSNDPRLKSGENEKLSFTIRCRKDLNNPLTAVRGINQIDWKMVLLESVSLADTRNLANM